jgi:hypothetical protein
MDYLKICNAPIRNVFPEKNGERIDWERVGISKLDMADKLTQGIDSNGDYTTLLPIANKSKLDTWTNASGKNIVTEINDYASQEFTAEIITEDAANIIKADIETVRGS